MVLEAVTLKYQILESELEALLVEAELIRTHQPMYNILLKDDKTPLYILITDDTFPRVLTVRKKELQQGLYKGTYLGPFPSGYKVKEILRISRKIFPWCNQAGSLDVAKDLKPCFYHHLELCSGACVGEVTQEEYREMIKQLLLFLKGKKKEVLRSIEQAMKGAAAEERYEEAGILHDKISVIRSVTERTYSLQPDMILPVLKMDEREESLIQLRRILTNYLHLPKTYPLQRIECYDVSNISGTNASVAMVTFIHGQAETSEYKLFNIRTLDTPNDYGMLQEALQRRQNHPEWGQPDLVVIDGGKGQLRAALSVWQWSTPVISIAKDPDRLLLPTTQIRHKNPLGPRYHEVKLPGGHSGLKLAQQLRDEAHRFSKKQHTRLRERTMFQ